MSKQSQNQRNEDFIYYSLDQTDKNFDHFSLQSEQKYFQLYEKYTERKPPYCVEQQKQQKQVIDFNYDGGAGERQERIHELQAENQWLRIQNKQQRQLIDRLKYQLYYCNTQLEQITKIETYEYHKAINDLQQEIEHMLERAKDTELHMVKFTHSQQQLTFKDKQLASNKAHIFLDCSKENQEVQFDNQKSLMKNKNEESQRKLIKGLYDMYQKVVGINAKSLKEIWKWLKGMALKITLISKWSRRYRELRKIPIQLKSQNLTQLLDEAMIIIN